MAKHPFLVRQQCWKGWRRCGERISFLVRRKQERHRADEKQEKAKNGEATRGRELAGYRNLGRKRERAQPAHCRAAGVELC